METRVNAALEEIKKVLAQDGGSIELVEITQIGRAHV